MYTPFSKIPWVVINICILLTKEESVKYLIDCLYIHLFTQNYVSLLRSAILYHAWTWCSFKVVRNPNFRKNTCLIVSLSCDGKCNLLIIVCIVFKIHLDVEVWYISISWIVFWIVAICKKKIHTVHSITFGAKSKKYISDFSYVKNFKSTLWYMHLVDYRLRH